MAKTLLFLSLILAALPNFNLFNGLPLLDVVIFGLILVHSIRSMEIFVELLLFVCLVFAVLLYRYSFNDIDLFEYLNFVLRYVIFYGMLLIPKRFYIVSRNHAIWNLMSMYLITVVSLGLMQMVLQGLVRREIEYLYFNDINILFFTLIMSLYIKGNRNPFIISAVLILTFVSGARLASLMILYYLIFNMSKRAIVITSLLAMVSFLFVPHSWFENLLLFDRLSEGMANDEYSRGALWLVYLNSLFELCTWCFIYDEFATIGLRIMRPAHNFFLSTIVINGVMVGMLVILRTILKVRSLINVKHFWVLLILLFFDIQFSRGLFLLLMIYDASRYEKASRFDFGIQ